MDRLTNLSDNEAAALSASMPAAQNASLGERIGGIEQSIPFFKTATLTSTAAGTAVSIVDASDVPDGKSIHIVDVVLAVDGSTAWTDDTATVVKIQDTADTPVVALTYAKAGLTANAVLGKIDTNITDGDDIITGAGLTADEGLEIVGDADFTAGSDIVVSVVGLFI